MDSILESINKRCATPVSARSFLTTLLIGFVVLVAAGVITAQMAIPYIPILLGSFAGAALFFGGYVVVSHLLPEERREKLNFRHRLTLPQRRFIDLWLIIGWILIVLVALRPIDSTGVVIGALNVAFLMFVWRFGSSTEEELQQMQELFEGQEEERERQEALDAEEANLDTLGAPEENDTNFRG